MEELAFPAARSVRKAANTGSVTSRSTILVMKISPNFFFSDNRSLFCSALGLIPLVLCYILERAKKVKVAMGQD